jgi:hypothetical protein
LGAHGEFAESFSKIVPYSRLRIFPFPIYEKGEKSVLTMKIPLVIKLDSKVCAGQTTIGEVPLEPIVIVAAASEK